MVHYGWIHWPDDRSGAVTLYIIPTPGYPGGITVGSDGALWFTLGTDQIGRITTAGEITTLTVPTANSQPDFITAGFDGALWFTEMGANQIGRITIAGVVTEVSPAGRYNSPTVIAAGPDGALWFIYNYRGAHRPHRHCRGGDE